LSVRSKPEVSKTNYLIFSDVHLGADLVQHVRPWTIARLREVARVDRELSSMLDWYRTRKDPERPWRLVIAGDLVDFIGMNIAPMPGSPLEQGLSHEERELGLGSTGAHAASKMRAVARRHPLAFSRLAAFVADGNSLVLVSGNHDVDFHWDAARQAFLDEMCATVDGLVGDAAARADFIARIEFCPWFYYEEGLLYVEHGHQFDAMCSYHHLLAPVSPQDPDRISWSFSDLLLRAVVRPTRGLRSDGHEGTGLFSYLKFAWSLGIRGGARLGYLYAAATTRALLRWRRHMGSRARALREEHERRMHELADRRKVRVERLRKIAALWPTPVTRGLVDVLRSVFLDRVAVVATLALVALAVWLFLPGWVLWPLGLVAGLASLLYFAWSTKLRDRDVDPKDAMFRGAVSIAELLPTRYVIMGHTHEPVLAPVSPDCTYVNLGHWGVDDLDGRPTEASRTHLVIRFVDGEHCAELLRWVPEEGPVRESYPP